MTDAPTNDGERDVGRATWRLATPPPNGGAAIALIHVRGGIDALFGRLGMAPVPIGGAVLRNFAGIDTGVVARYDAATAMLMPHAGPAVVRGVLEALAGAGARPAGTDDPEAMYPEARTPLEAMVLAALAEAASPLAIEPLLGQARRWGDPPDRASLDRAARGLTEADLARSRRLIRLIDPPLVVALGRPNIGKSSLVNALAGRDVSIVADEAGTTRDHVGVTLDLAGLVVRYIDAPGLSPEGRPSPGSPSSAVDPDAEILAEAQAMALHAAGAADLILLAADASAGFIDNPFPRVPSRRVALRADLGPTAEPPSPGCSVSVARATGLEPFVLAVRRALVSDEDLAHPGPWLFWDRGR